MGPGGVIRQFRQPGLPPAEKTLPCPSPPCLSPGGLPLPVAEQGRTIECIWLSLISAFSGICLALQGALPGTWILLKAAVTLDPFAIFWIDLIMSTVTA